MLKASVKWVGDEQSGHLMIESQIFEFNFIMLKQVSDNLRFLHSVLTIVRSSVLTSRVSRFHCSHLRRLGLLNVDFLE